MFLHVRVIEAVLCACLMLPQVQVKEQVQLGVILDTSSDEIQSALVSGLQQQRQNQALPFTLVPAVSVINTADIYKISRLVCERVFSLGAHVLLSHVNSAASATLRSYATTFHVPLVSPWLPQHNGPLSGNSLDDFAVSIRPDYHAAILDLAHHYHWHNAVYLYDSDDGALRLQHILQHQSPMSDSSGDHHWALQITHARRVFAVSDVLALLYSMEQADRWSNKHIILDCEATLSKQVIVAHVNDIRLGRRTYHYIFGGLIFDENWEETGAEFSAINITGLRLVSRDSAVFQSVTARWRASSGRSLRVSAHTALMYDAVMVIGEALRRVWSQLPLKPGQWPLNAASHRLLPRRQLNCTRGYDDKQNYDYGQQVLRQLTLVNVRGLTGNISFSESGRRVNYLLDVVEMSPTSQPIKVGEWSDTAGLTHTLQLRDTDSHLPINRTLTIVSVEEEPFLKRISNSMGDTDYVGFCADLIRLLANEIGFDYRIRLIHDGKYGSMNSTHHWNGIMGDLVRHKADVAVAALSVTLMRERSVFFTKPFMTTGLTVLMKRQLDNDAHGAFTFLAPFSSELWLCMLCACLAVAVVLFLVMRFSPYENTASSRQSLAYSTETTAAHQLSLHYCLWNTVATVLHQHSTLVQPRSMSGRVVCICWWLASLLFVTSYTANLAALYTVKRLASPVDSVSALARQNDIEYGVVNWEPTLDFFRNSKISLYQSMWQQMLSRPSSFVHSTSAGISRVRNSQGRYALLADSAVVDYVTGQRPCDLVGVGRPLSTNNYAIATPRDSSLKKAVNLAILKFTDNGEIERLRQKWWRVDAQCHHSSQETSFEPLVLPNLAGVFFVLIAGLVVAMLVALIEFCHKSRSDADLSKMSHISSMRAQARLTLACDSELAHERKQYYGASSGEALPSPRRASMRLTSPQTHV